MKFSVETALLHKAVGRVSSVLDKKRLYGIRISLIDGVIAVSCSNGESTMRELIAVTNAQGDDVLFLDYDRFYAILGKEKGLLHFDAVSTRISVTGNNATYELGTKPVPVEPNLDSDAAMIRVESTVLGRAFTMAGLTDSLEVYKSYAMNKVCLEVSSGQLLIWSIDPKRLVISQCQIIGEVGYFKAILPDYACAYASTIFPEKDKLSAPVKISIAGADVVFASESRTFATRQSAGNLPNPHGFIRRESPYEFKLNTKELFACLQKTVVALDDTHRACRLRYENGKLYFTVSSSSGTVNAWIDAQDNGMQTDHYIDPKLLADFVRRLDDAEVTIGFSDASTIMAVKASNVISMISEMTK